MEEIKIVITKNGEEVPLSTLSDETIRNIKEAENEQPRFETQNVCCMKVDVTSGCTIALSSLYHLGRHGGQGPEGVVVDTLTPIEVRCLIISLHKAMEYIDEYGC